MYATARVHGAVTATHQKFPFGALRAQAAQGVV